MLRGIPYAHTCRPCTSLLNPMCTRPGLRLSQHVPATEHWVQQVRLLHAQCYCQFRPLLCAC